MDITVNPYKCSRFVKETMSLAEDFSSLDGKQILIVDDNDDSLELMGFILEECQVDVIKARSVAEALGCLNRSRPNLLISDISMPGEDGYVLMEKVKQLTDKQGWQLPVIALTAFVTEEEKIRLLAAGFQMHLSKPIAPDDLLAAIITIMLRSET